MMTYRKLGDFIAAEPFRPFRIRMASGQSFEIRHPEMISVSRTSARVYSATGENEDERWHEVSLLLMESVEFTDSPMTVTQGK